MANEVVCPACGQLLGVEEYNSKLWELYYHLDIGGRQYIKPLVYIPGEDFDPYDQDDFDAIMLAMEKNMVERGLCGECGRPNLAGKTAEDFLSEEDAKDLAAMYAEMAAERRMGA
jgi:hypothetical protein